MSFTCPLCSNDFERRSKHGNDPVFCSPKCRSKWHYVNDIERHNEYARKWRANNRARVRASKLRRQYGLDQEAFDAILANQSGGCAICGSADPRGSNWHVDHDHNCCPPSTSCGQCVRGILCGPCNRGLGYFGDNEQTLIAAARYLECGAYSRLSIEPERMSIVRGV